MALRALVKTDVSRLVVAPKSSTSHLYRSIIRELPRVLTIYDVDMPLRKAKDAVAYHFRKHAHLEDPRIINILIAKGYMELEETLMQWKQQSHLMNLLEPVELDRAYLEFLETKKDDDNNLFD